MLHIDIRSLTPGLHSETLNPAPEDLDFESDRFDEIEVQVHMDFDGSRILVHMDASAVATLECDRTLVEFDQPIKGSYSVLFAPPYSLDTTDDVEEVVPIDPNDEEVDITSAVRDTLLLAIPTRKVAPGAEDADIQTEFGEPAEEEVDPRWEALKKLKDG